MDAQPGKPRIVEIKRPAQPPQPPAPQPPPEPPIPEIAIEPQAPEPETEPEPRPRPQPPAPQPTPLAPPEPRSQEDNPIVAQMRAEAMRDMDRQPASTQPAPRILQGRVQPQQQAPALSEALPHQELKAKIAMDQAQREKKKGIFSALGSLFKKKPKPERGLLDA